MLLCRLARGLGAPTRRQLLLAAIGASLLSAGCPAQDDGTNPEPLEELPPLELGDDTEDVLLTWIDEHGETHTEVAVSEVPAAQRGQVRVIVTKAPPAIRSSVYVADLTHKDEHGRYPVRSMRRSEWEALIAARRPSTRPAASVAQRAPAGGASSGEPAHGEPGAVQAIVYGASWCKPCHQAAAYLRRRGAQVIERDIEEDPRARAEMTQKLRTSGRSGGTIPVLDVAGIVLVGFSPAQIDQAIARAQRGTAL